MISAEDLAYTEHLGDYSSPGIPAKARSSAAIGRLAHYWGLRTWADPAIVATAATRTLPRPWRTTAS